MIDSNRVAKMIVVKHLDKFGDSSMTEDLRASIIVSIKNQVENAFELGKQHAVDILFPEINDDYFMNSPLRDAALKVIFGDTK